VLKYIGLFKGKRFWGQILAVKILSVNDFRVRALHIALIGTFLVSITVSVVYIILKTYIALVIIAVLTVLYLNTYLLLKYQRTLLARIWYLAILMMHITAMTFLFSSLSGFHYYFFIIPSLSGLLFNVENFWQRIYAILFFLGALTAFLLFNYSDPKPYVEISQLWYSRLNISSGITAMLTLFVGFSFIAIEIVKSKKHLIHLATIDSLTGIFNRREFFVRGQNEIDRSLRYNTPLSLLMIDLDYFKRINDAYGHAKGDAVLKQFADTCNNQIRTTDVFARLGGEEFGMILPGSDNREAQIFAERLREKIECLSIPSESGNISVTISIGITTGTQKNISLTRMMQDADKALYQAKDQGRNRVVVNSIN
jgi:diguanylate cyclase (GGDEF)-like protein